MFDYRREQLLSPQSRSSEPIAQNIISRIKNCSSEILGMYSYLLGLIQYNHNMPIIKDKNCWRAAVVQQAAGPAAAAAGSGRSREQAPAERAKAPTEQQEATATGSGIHVFHIPVYLDELVGVVTRRHFSSVIKIEVNSRLYLFSVAE